MASMTSSEPGTSPEGSKTAATFPPRTARDRGADPVRHGHLASDDDAVELHDSPSVASLRASTTSIPSICRGVATSSRPIKPWLSQSTIIGVTVSQ